MQIPLDRLEPNPYRLRASIDEEDLEELSESLRQHGVMQPITVRPLEGERYQIIAGERRWRAAHRAGMTSVPCIARDCDDKELLAMALAENLQRADLNPIEAARGYQKLMTEFGLTQEEAAAVVGKSRSAVANTLRLLQLPEDIQEFIAADRLSEGHGRALLALLDDVDQLRALAAQTVAKGYTVRELEAKVRAAKGRAVRKRAVRVSAENSLELEEIKRRLQTALATAVRIKPRGKGGVVEIEYYSDEDLTRLVEQITGAEGLA